MKDKLTKSLHTWMALVYFLAAGIPVYQVIRHTDNEMQYLIKINDTNNLQNNGAVKEASFWKEICAKHHFLGPIIDHFFQPTLDHQFQIPPLKEAQAALGKIPDLNEQQKTEAATALFWSMLLLMISLVYFGLTFFKRDEIRSDHIIFPFTIILVVFLVIGILAPAMVIDVSPKTPGFPRFILDYQVRSIFGVISELFESSYWIVAVCLTVFSILIPLAKAGLTVYVLKTGSLPRKLKIANFLHSISKWSMADVFVAAILLADFAVKSNENTQANLFLGFYYFLSYCLLSMVTTTLLERKIEKLYLKVKVRVTKKARVPRSRIR